VTDALYECTGADALFATSGGPASADGHGHTHTCRWF